MMGKASFSVSFAVDVFIIRALLRFTTTVFELDIMLITAQNRFCFPKISFITLQLYILQF